MFDLGSSLRAAREAGGLTLAEAEEKTKIRSRYLSALEGERFDELPHGYGRAFLRTYAEFLELDPRHYLDEYASRLPPEEPQLALPARPRRRRPRLLGALVVLAIVAGLLAAAAAYFGAPDEQTVPPERPRAAPPRRTPLRPPVARPTPPAPRKTVPPASKAPVGPVRVVVRAAGGDCWVLVRVGSETGRALAERVLADGQSVSALAKPLLWIRLGAPRYAVVTVAGRRVAVSQAGAPVNLLVGRRGAKTVR